MGVFAFKLMKIQFTTECKTNGHEEEIKNFFIGKSVSDILSIIEIDVESNYVIPIERTKGSLYSLVLDNICFVSEIITINEFYIYG